MIIKLFEILSASLQAAPAVALAGAFAWGVLSILLSPCHLSSIPLIVGFISGAGRVSAKRAFVLSALFSSGIMITIAAVGLITGLAGRILDRPCGQNSRRYRLFRELFCRRDFFYYRPSPYGNYFAAV